jgi:hypothetical protein
VDLASSIPFSFLENLEKFTIAWGLNREKASAHHSGKKSWPSTGKVSATMIPRKGSLGGGLPLSL